MPVTQAGDKVLISWDDITDFEGPDGLSVPWRGPKWYMVRRGVNWAHSVYVGCVTCHPWLITENWAVGTETYFVRAMSSSGRFSAEPASVEVTLVTPPDHPVDSFEDSHLSGFPGSITDLEVESPSGDLVFTVGGPELTGEWVSDPIDMGSVARWRIGTLAHVEYTNPANTWENTWENDTSTWEDDFTSWANNWESNDAVNEDWYGDIYFPSGTWKLEARVTTASPTNEDYFEFKPGEYYGRYIQFKLTLNRENKAELLNVSAFRTTWSQLPSGSGSGGGSTQPIDIDVTASPYNVVTNVNTKAQSTANYNGLQMALDVAFAGSGGRAGGRVNLPTGWIYIDAGLIVKNYTRLIGKNSRATVLSCWAGASPFVDTEVIQLGDKNATNPSLDIVFGCRVEHMTIDCAEIANTVGVFSNKAQEHSGLFNVTITRFGSHGVKFDNTGVASASIVGIDNCGIDTTVSGGIGVEFSGVAGQNFIKNCTIQGNFTASAYLTDGILISGTDVHIEGVHFETCIDGIDWSGTGFIDSCYGHPTVTNLIHARSGSRQYTLRNVVANNTNPGSNLLVDDTDGVNYPVVDFGNFDHYVGHLIFHGEVQLRRRTQTGGSSSVYFPNTIGDDVDLVSMLSSDAFGANRLCVGSTTSGTRVQSVTSVGFTMINATNTWQYLIRGGGTTGITTLDLPVPFGGSGSDQLVSLTSVDQLRKKTLVEPYIKANTGGDWPILSAMTQSDLDNVAMIPNMSIGTGKQTRFIWTSSTPISDSIVFADDTGLNYAIVRAEQTLAFQFNVKFDEPAAASPGETVHLAYREGGSSSDPQVFSGFQRFTGDVEVISSSITGLTLTGSSGGDGVLLAAPVGGYSNDRTVTVEEPDGDDVLSLRDSDQTYSRNRFSTDASWSHGASALMTLRNLGVEYTVAADDWGSTDRQLSVPTVDGNRTLALIDQDQAWDGDQDHTAARFRQFAIVSTAFDYAPTGDQAEFIEASPSIDTTLTVTLPSPETCKGMEMVVVNDGAGTVDILGGDS